MLRDSVRVRTTALAMAVVTLTLVAASVGLLHTLRSSLERGGDDVARSRAHDLAALATSGSLPTTVTARGDDDIVQIVDDQDHVLAATPGTTRARITMFVPRSTAPAVRTVAGVPDDNERETYRVWALRARASGGPVTVYVGTSLEVVSETMARLRRALLIGVPVLLVLLGTLTWLLLERALRPVEAIRTQVADISDRALDLRVAVPSSDDEIARLARTMNAMLDRLESASARQRSFVADASHELQGPLAAFRAQLEVASAHPAQVDWTATARDLIHDSDRMERLVRDLLFLARDEGLSQDPRRDHVDLDDLVLEEAIRLRSQSRLTVDTSRVSAAPVQGNRDDLSRLVRNLLQNADAHGMSLVRVRLELQDGYAALSVEDDGSGVPPEHRQRVFDRFYRVDDVRGRETGGSGLGLAIVRTIAERHHGTVRLDDRSDGAANGARFVVRIPVSGDRGS